LIFYKPFSRKTQSEPTAAGSNRFPPLSAIFNCCLLAAAAFFTQKKAAF
jgi:hypothetical protein